MPNAVTEWNACGYVRLSHEDGDKEESNSVTGQKALLRDFFSKHPELHGCEIKVDDGYTGSNFDRPGFQELMADVRAGKITCIVVKDLSRFGRNYLDAGEYIERIFPFLGVRFIAIHDHYDSLHHHEASDELLIPFKNLLNEAYCRDSSLKIRSQLAVKRSRGEYLGSFAVYGYRKDPDHPHRLLVDSYAAHVVRDIFRWKLEGVSAGEIAHRLNSAGILSPLDYKLFQGLRYSTPFRVNAQSRWSASSVLRILKNPTYIGTLEQGKCTTPSYKVKRRVHKPREEWAVTERHHEAIIHCQDFETVQKLLALDTRTSPGKETVALFSGLVFCGECGAAMVRKTVPSGTKKYTYYVCAAHKKDKTCHPHSLRDQALEALVLQDVRRQLQTRMDPTDWQTLTAAVPLETAPVQKLQERLAQKQEELARVQRLLSSLYEHLTDGVIDRQEYHDFKKTYRARSHALEKQAHALQEALDHRLQHRGPDWQRLTQPAIPALDRPLLVSLLDRIFIYQDKRVELVYRWRGAVPMEPAANGQPPTACAETEVI